ncbi:MAG: hypothetical protein IIC73_03895 [Armatimonadetes bacterium]|nr:hypothetical protein [Armatimonadota bacterium]
MDILSLCGSATQLAYIDGGTGSLIVQAALAGVLGLAATLKIYWAQMKMRFFRIGPKKGESGTEDA